MDEKSKLFRAFRWLIIIGVIFILALFILILLTMTNLI